MSKCPSCGNSFPGLAAACPSCGRALPVTGYTSPVAPHSPRRSAKPRIIGIVVGILVGAVFLVAGFYIDLLSNFCLDFNSEDGDDCAQANQNFVLIMVFVVVPLSVAAGIATGVALTRGLRRRASRRAS